MRALHTTVLWLALCCSIGGASVLVETYGWWDTDAGTSWTMLLLMAYAASFAFGMSLANKPFRAPPVLLGALVIGMASAAPLLVGFGVKAMGVAVPWRAPSGNPLIGVLLTWVLLCGLILVAQGLGRTAKRLLCRHRPRGQAA